MGKKQETGASSDYTSNTYKALKAKVSGFNKSEEEFRNELSSNPEYSKNVHKALTDKVGGFNKSYDEFNELINPVQVNATPQPVATTVEKKNPNVSQIGVQEPTQESAISSTEIAQPSTGLESPLPQAVPNTGSGAISQGLQGIKPTRPDLNAPQSLEQEMFNYQQNQPVSLINKETQQPTIVTAESVNSEGGETSDIIYKNVPENIQNAVDVDASNLFKRLYEDRSGNDKVNISEAEVSQYMQNNLSNKFQDPLQQKQYAEALNERVFGNKFENSTKDSEFFVAQDKYKKEERTNTAKRILSQEFGDNIDPLIEDLTINAKKKSKDSEKTFDRDIDITKVNIDLSDESFDALYNKSNRFFKSGSNTVIDGDAFMYRQSPKGYEDYNSSMENVELSKEEVKGLYNKGKLTFPNPIKENSIFNSYASNRGSEILEDKSNNKFKEEVAKVYSNEDFDGMNIKDKEKAFSVVEGNINKYTDKLLTEEERSIKNEYKTLYDLGAKNSSIQQDYKYAQNEINKLHEDGSPLREAESFRLDKLRLQSEISQENFDKKKGNILKMKESSLASSGDLFDPETGKKVGSNEGSREEVKKWNDDVKSKTEQYSKGYKGSLKKAKVKTYYKLESLKEAILNQDRLKEYKETIEAGGVPYDFFGNDDQLLVSYQETAAELEAIMKAEVLNLDMANLESKYWGIDSFGENVWDGLVSATLGETSSLGTTTTKDIVNDFVNVAADNGIELSKEEIKRAEGTFSEKLGGAVGSSIPAMVQIGLSQLVLNEVGIAKGAASLFNVIKGLATVKKSKNAIKALELIESATMSGLSFELAGQGFGTGVGEAGGKALGDMLGAGIPLEKIMAGSPVGKFVGTALKTFATKVGGATGQTIEEYAGEFVQELSENDLTTAFANTIGDDPFEKLAITYTIGGIFGLSSLGADWKNSKIEIEEKLLEYNGGNQTALEVKKAIEEEREFKKSLTSEAQELFDPSNEVDESKQANLDKLNEAIANADVEGLEKGPETDQKPDLELEITNPEVLANDVTEGEVVPVQGETKGPEVTEEATKEQTPTINEDTETKEISTSNTPTPVFKSGMGNVNTDMKKALTKDVVPTTFRQAVLQMFIDGRLKLDGDTLTKETGYGRVDYAGNKKGKTEKGLRHWFVANKDKGEIGTSLDDIIGYIADNPDWGYLANDATFGNIIEILESHTSPRSMSEELYKDNSFEGKVYATMEEKGIAEQNAQESQEAADELEAWEKRIQEVEITEEEISAMEGEDKFNETINKLTDEEIEQHYTNYEAFNRKGETKQPITKRESKVSSTDGENIKTKEVEKEITKLRSNSNKYLERAAKLRGESGGTLSILPNAIATAYEALGNILAVADNVNEAIKKFRNSDEYKNLSQEDKSSIDNDINEDFKDELEAPEATPKETKPKTEKEARKERKAKRDNRKTSSTTGRVLEQMEDSPTKDFLTKASKYKPQNQEQMSNEIDALIESVGNEKALELALDGNNKMEEDLRHGIILYAAGNITREARTEYQQAIKDGDVEAQEDALEKERRALIEVNNVSQLGTKMGQINAFKKKVYERFPDVYAMSRRIELDNAASALNEENEDGVTLRQELKDVQEDIKDDIDEAIDEAFSDGALNDRIKELEAEVEKLKKEPKTESKSKKKSTYEKGKLQIKEGLALLKKSSSSASLSVIGLNDSQIEGITKIIAGIINTGVGSTANVVKKTLEYVKSALPNVTKDNIKIIASQIAEYNAMRDSEMEARKESNITRLTKKLKDLQEGKETIDLSVRPEDSAEVKSLKEEIAKERVITPKLLREIAKDHYKGKNPHSRSLAEKIAAKTGLDADASKAVADSMEAMINEKIDQIVEKQVKAFVDYKRKSISELREGRDKGTLTDKELIDLEDRIAKSKESSEINKIRKLIKKGDLSDNSFREAFQKRFGFRELNDATKARLNQLQNQLVNLMTKLDKEIVKTNGEKVVINSTNVNEIHKISKELNSLIYANKKTNLAIILKEIMSGTYMGMLSGPLTFIRAGIGGYSSGAFQAVVYGLSNLKHLGVFIKGIYTAMPAAYKRAVISRKTGLDYFGENSMKGIESNTQAGRVENYMLRGLAKSLKDGKVIDSGAKFFGQSLKVIHALGALDTFMNTLAVGGIANVEAKKEKARLENKKDKSDAEKKRLAQLNNLGSLNSEFKDIAKAEVKDRKDAISEMVDQKIKNGELPASKRQSEIDSIFKETVGLTGSRLNAERTYVTNRVQELRENQLGGQLDVALSMAKEASLMGKPDGFAGLGFDKVAPLLSIKDTDSNGAAVAKFLGGSVFRFFRLGLQVLNKTTNNIPVWGIANAFFGPGINPVTGEWNKTALGKLRANPVMANQRFVNNLVITGAITALAANMFDFGDDDDDLGTKLLNILSPKKWKLNPDRAVDVRGFGFGGQGGAKKNARIFENYMPVSISFTKDKNGNFTNYFQTILNSELSSIAVTVASFSDDTKLREFGDTQSIKDRQDGGITSYFWKVMGDNLRLSTEGSFSSVGRIMKDVNSEENLLDGIVYAGKQLGAGMVRPIVNPSVISSGTKLFQAAAGMNQSNVDGAWTSVVNNWLGVDRVINDDKTDVFGNPYPEQNDFEKFFKFTKRSENPDLDKTVGMQYKFGNGVDIQKKYFNNMEVGDVDGFIVKYKGYPSRHYRVLSGDLQAKAKKYQEAEFNKLMVDNYEYLNSFEEFSSFEKEIKKYQTKSEDKAKKYIYQKYKNTGKIEKVEK